MAVALAPNLSAPRTLAVADDEDLDPDLHLGYGLTFTLPDAERDLATFLRSWQSNGLNVGDLPEARGLVDVARSAFASVRHKENNGKRIEIAATELENNARVCSYQIDRKVWDRGKRVIEYQRGMRAVFDKRTNTISFDTLDCCDREMEKLQQTILAHFRANQRTIPGQKIRNAVREQLLAVGAQNLRKKAGGLYFVKPEFSGEETRPVLHGLKGMLADMYGEDADFFYWAFARNESVQQMVRKHFVANVNDRAAELAVKAIERVRQGKTKRGVNPELVSNLLNEQRKLHAAVREFEEVVTLEQQDLSENLKVLANAIEQLQDLADQG